ncbi:hypothetical protein D1871_11035 [Nakamurella silvestris]|nr:hypothetical protein D1871_11035 [Nakamurella silvestris]
MAVPAIFAPLALLGLFQIWREAQRRNRSKWSISIVRRESNGYVELDITIGTAGVTPRYSVEPYVAHAFILEGTWDGFERIGEFKVGGRELTYSITFPAVDIDSVRFGLTWTDEAKQRQHGERWSTQFVAEVWKWRRLRPGVGRWIPKQGKRHRKIPTDDYLAWLPSQIGPSKQHG